MEELAIIGLYDNEGSKLYMDESSKAVREAVFKSLTGIEPCYYQHKGIPSSSRWEEVKYGTEGGFWKGSVITEADINFSTGIYNICDMIDIYVVIDTLIDLGAIVITTIIIVEATPIVVVNMEALVYYIKNFGIRQGLEMYTILGVENLPNGVISWLKTDMADGDSSLDDFVEKGGARTNTLTEAQKSRLNALDNTIKHNLKETDFSGTLRDLQGNPVPNPQGGIL